VASVKTTIDGQELEVERDRWALGVIQEMGTFVPTMCDHPALQPYGACRLCVVEVTKGKWTWLTTSCDLPIREGLTIRTDTPAVRQARKTALELLWAQAPNAEPVQYMAKRLGVEKPRFAPRGDGKCILCGLCVRVCRELVGPAAVDFAKRGAKRTVETPMARPSADCIGCEACVKICPTGHIQSIDDGPIRRMSTWNTELQRAQCVDCGQSFGTTRQVEHVNAKLDDLAPEHIVCPACRRRRAAKRMTAAATLIPLAEEANETVLQNQ
jgi:bidirectional [NiFe] hydrogenase diaphorase subunit